VARHRFLPAIQDVNFSEDGCAIFFLPGEGAGKGGVVL